MISTALWLVVVFFGAGCIVWGPEEFAEHLAAAGRSLGVSTFALALLLAGAKPEELATCLTASARKLPTIAVGDVIGANITACLLALGVGGARRSTSIRSQGFQICIAGAAVGSYWCLVRMGWHRKQSRRRNPDSSVLCLHRNDLVH